MRCGKAKTDTLGKTKGFWSQPGNVRRRVAGNGEPAHRGLRVRVVKCAPTILCSTEEGCGIVPGVRITFEGVECQPEFTIRNRFVALS